MGPKLTFVKTEEKDGNFFSNKRNSNFGSLLGKNCACFMYKGNLFNTVCLGFNLKLVYMNFGSEEQSAAERFSEGIRQAMRRHYVATCLGNIHTGN